MGQRTCGQCGVDISDRHPRARYCDPKCRKAAEVAKRDPEQRRAKDQAKRAERLAQMGPRTCAACRASIDHRPTHAKYCDDYCAKRAECIRDYVIRLERARAYGRTNKERIKRWRRENAELSQASARRYYWKNREAMLARNREWEARNPGSAVLRATRRRLLKLENSAGLLVTTRDIRRLIHHYGGCCAYCGVRPEKLHIDHVVPIARGGRHSIGNLLPACADCNLSKNATLLSVWRHRREGAGNGRTRYGAQVDAVPGAGFESTRGRDAARRGRRRVARATAA